MGDLQNFGDQDVRLKDAAGNDLGTISNPLKVETTGGSVGGLLDAGNSTVTVLGANATFTGTAIDLLNYQSSIVYVYSDKASATDGLVFQWSSSTDFTNALESTGNLDAGQKRGFSINKRGRYFRIKYTNGSQAQTTFVIGAVHSAVPGGVTRPLKDSIDGDNFAATTKSILWGKNPSNTYVEVRTNGSGRLIVTNDSVGETGLTTPTSASLLGGTDGTNLRAISVDSSGVQKVRESVGYSEFNRINAKMFKDSEEARFDIPASLVSSSTYVAVAPDGTSTSATSWTIVRTYFNAAGNPERQRIRTGVAWDSRTSGWT